MKKRLKKALSLIMAILMMISVFPITTAFAASNVEKVDSSTELDVDYGWTFKFISGVTTTECVGFTPYEDDYYYIGSDSDGNTTTISLSTSNYDICRITSDSQKGNIGYIYHNVGQYQGKTISLKATVTDWDKISTGGTISRTDGVANGNPNYCFISFGKRSFVVDVSLAPKLYSPTIKYEFFDEDTGESVNIKGHTTFKDIDGTSNTSYAYGEGVAFPNSSEIYKILLSENTQISQNSDNVFNAGQTGNCTNDDITHWVQILFNSSSLTVKLSSCADTSSDVYKTRRGFNHFFFSPDTLAPFSNPKIEKSVSKSSINATEEFYYTLTFYVPYLDIDNYYTSFDIKDILSECVNVKNVSVTDDSKADASSFFNININDSELVISASKLTNSDFYNKTYTVKILCYIPDGYEKYSTLASGDNVALVNKATLITNLGESVSNEVSTDLTYSVITSATNGTITQSSTNLCPGTDKTISATPNKGYYISSVLIDGTPVDIENETSFSYTFENISANHTVQMICSPYTYYNVNIKYVDENGVEIANPVSQSVQEKTSYDVTEITEGKDITYYTQTSIDGDITGVANSDVNIVVHYTRNHNTVTVNYLDKKTNAVLAEPYTLDCLQGTSFSVVDEVDKDIDYYTKYSVSGDTEGVITYDLDVYVYYEQNERIITINYIDKETNSSIKQPVTIKLPQGTEYDVTEDTADVSIDYYSLDSVSGYVTGTLVDNETINVYYTHKQNVITVDYVDVETGETLLESESFVKYQGSSYDLSDYIDKEVKYFEIQSVEGETTGTLLEDVNVTVYYQRLSDTITFHYVELLSGEEISEQEIATLPLGLSYDLSSYTDKDIQYFTKSDVEGVLEADEFTGAYDVYVYYIHNVNSITIEYIDEDTNQQLAESVIYVYSQGSNYDVTLDTVKDILYFSQTSVEGDPVTGLLENDLTITVKYKHIPVTLSLKYIDKATGQEIADSVSIDMYMGDDYDLSDLYNISIDGYNYQSTSGDIQGVITGNLELISYYDEIPAVTINVKSPDTGIDTNVVAAMFVSMALMACGLIMLKKTKRK